MYYLLWLFGLFYSNFLVNCNNVKRNTVKTDKPVYRVYRVWTNSTEDADYIVSLFNSASNLQLNFWKEPSSVGEPMDIMVPNTKSQIFEQLLRYKKLKNRIIISDVEKLILENESHMTEKILFDDTNPNLITNFSLKSYHNYNEIRAYMHNLEEKFPKIVRVYSLGTTTEGRPIEMIKIGSSSLFSSKKAIWIDGGIHAREWISITTALYFVHKLATKYDTDNQIKEFVDKLDWFILPVANPDGYEYTRSSTDPSIRLFRKSRSRDGCRADEPCCNGVDLNRNFDFHWNEVGSSGHSCDDTFSGSSAFSEIETRAIRDFLLPRKNDVQAFLTLHSYAQAFMYPYGHANGTYPADVDDLENVARQASKAMKSVYGTRYSVGSPADHYYAASGGSSDWAKEKLAIKYSYIIELRPEYYQEHGFVLHELQILPTAKETWEGVKIVADAVLKNIGMSRTSSNTVPDIKTCSDNEPNCRWLAAVGGCFNINWKDIEIRCPYSCKVCDQKED